MAITATNTTAYRALAGLQSATELFDDATMRISTGLRVRSAADDPGAFSMGTRLQTRTLSLQATRIGVQTDISLTQTAEDAIGSIITSLRTIRTLALNSSSATTTTADRTANQTQVNDLIAEINRISASTFFNGKSLLNGDYKSGKSTLFFQVGPDAGADNRITMNIRTMSATALGVNDVDVRSINSALAALDDIDSAINVSTAEDANVGGKKNRLESAEDNLSDSILNHRSAISSLLDADLAEAIIDQARGALLRDTSASALAQANLSPQKVLGAILPTR